MRRKLFHVDVKLDAFLVPKGSDHNTLPEAKESNLADEKRDDKEETIKHDNKAFKNVKQ